MLENRFFLKKKKRTNDNPDREIPLVRSLGLIQTVFLGVGTAIGGVIFAIIGKAANAAGPSVVITFLVGAVFAFSWASVMLSSELLCQQDLAGL